MVVLLACLCVVWLISVFEVAAPDDSADVRVCERHGANPAMGFHALAVFCDADAADADASGSPRGDLKGKLDGADFALCLGVRLVVRHADADGKVCAALDAREPAHDAVLGCVVHCCAGRCSR